MKVLVNGGSRLHEGERRIDDGTRDFGFDICFVGTRLLKISPFDNYEANSQSATPTAEGVL